MMTENINVYLTQREYEQRRPSNVAEQFGRDVCRLIEAPEIADEEGADYLVRLYARIAFRFARLSLGEKAVWG